MKRDRELDRLTTLLGQCLGRIDEQAYRLQQVDDEAEDCTDDGVADVLENEAARLQELVGSLLERADAPEQSDLDEVVHASVRGCMQELGSPIVVRHDRNLQDRAQTLCEFVTSFRGTCRVAYDEQQNLLIVLELPLALAIDER